MLRGKYNILDLRSYGSQISKVSDFSQQIMNAHTNISSLG